MWLRRHKGAVVFGLTLALISLGLADAWKYGIVSADWLAKRKDALSALSSLVTLLVLVAGSTFSYYRFFRGRTLSLRLELAIAVSIHKAPNATMLHAITLTAKNVGGSTIWNPSPELVIITHMEEESLERITDWWDEPTGDEQRLTAPVIDPDEAVTFFAQREIPQQAWAVTYTACVRADTGDAWFTAKTVSNEPPE
jgi:hypothetical protein